MSENETEKGVTTTLKWFEPHKGFGFVHHADSNTDAFLHYSTLKQAGYDTLLPGATIVCDLDQDEKGKHVSKISSIDDSTAMNELNQPGNEVSGPVTAEIKFYNVNKGFGFAVVQELEEDVFLPGKLVPFGQKPESGQTIQLSYRKDPRGLTAVKIDF